MIIFSDEPMPEVSVQEVKQILLTIHSADELVDLYVLVHYKFWFIEDDLYDFEEGTEAYKRMCNIIDEWSESNDQLTDRVIHAAMDEGLLFE